MFRRLFKLIVLLVFICIVPVLITAGLFASERGSRWLVYWLIENNHIPLTIGKVQGRLLDEIYFKGLHYLDQDGNEIDLGSVNLVWSAADLIRFQVNVESIDARQLTIKLANDKKGPVKIPEIELPSLPVTVHVENLHLSDIRILTGDYDQQIERIQGNLNINKNKLELKLNKVQSAEQEFVFSALMTREKTASLDIDLQWTGTIEGEPGQGQLHLSGPQDNMALKLEIDSIARVNASGKLDLTAGPPTAELQGDISGELPQSVTDYVKLVSPLHFRLKGDTDFFEAHVTTELQTMAGEILTFVLNSDVAIPGASSGSVNITYDWQTTPAQENRLLTMSGQGDIEYLNDVLTIDHELTAPAAMQLNGNIDFSKQTRLDVRLDWQEIKLAVTDSTNVQVPSGYLNASGTLDSIAMFAKTRFVTLSEDENADRSETPDTNMFTYLTVDGEMDTSKDYPTGEFSGTVKGPVPALFKEWVQKLDAVQFNLMLDQDTANLSVQGSAHSVSGNQFDLKLNSSMDLPYGEKDKLAADVDWSITPLTDSSLLEHSEGKGRLHYEKGHLVISHDLLAPFQVTLNGDVFLMKDADTSLRFDIDWQNLEFPVEDQAPWQSEQGNIHIEGPVSSLEITAQGNFQSSPYGPVRLDTRANWSDPVLKFNQLSIIALDGNIEGKGQITLDNISSGQFDLGARNINLEIINPDLKSRLDLTATIDFSLVDDELNGQLQVPSLSGQWRGHPLQGAAVVSSVENRIHVESLHLKSGKNSIDLQLDISELLAGYLDLSITDMSVFSSELAGAIHGHFEIDGTPETPRFAGQVEGDNIYADDLRIASVMADMNFDLRPRQHSTLNIRTGIIHYEDWLIDELKISGTGLTEFHTLDITASGKELQMTASIDGSLVKSDWYGTLKLFEFNAPQTGAWSLDSPSRLDWLGEAGKLALTKTCLEQNDSSLCLTASLDAQKDFNGEIQLGRIPMGLAQPWIPDTISIYGTVSGDIFLNRLNEHWELHTSLAGSDTQIHVGLEKENADTLDVQQVTLVADVTQHKREWNLQLSSPEFFDISLDGSIQNTGEQAVAANLNMVLHQMDWLARVEPALTGSRGKFEVRAQTSGTIDQPQVKAEFNLHNGQLSILPIGLDLDRISGDFQTGTEYRQILIRSVLGSGGRNLELEGHASMFSDKGYSYQLKLRGDQFPFIRTADISLDVSPDLDLYGSQELHNVRGNISIPRLEMQVTSIPEGSVTVSPDTELIQSRQAGAAIVEDTNSGNDFIRNNLNIDINVMLGANIHIQGFGLDTRLAGDINVIKPVGVYQPRGEGFVTLSEGSYRAYGQNLVIDEGQLQFAGPLDNPGIRIRAYRPNLKVRPGVKVVGNVRQPKLSLYSEPVQSQADTLSYLITGRPITGASGGDANLLTQAALTLGAQESAVLTNQIESMFNLEEFSVGSGSTVESTSVSAAKRLSPNLTFRSSFNPFDQLWSFLLNYRLTDHWSVQSESGVSQGADVIYSVETNKLSDLFRKIWSFGE